MIYSQIMTKILDVQTEVKVVALIARGDTYGSIQALLRQDGIEISTQTLAAIKKRNSEALSHIKSEIIKLESSKATAILEKSRNLIEKKLDLADDDTTPKWLQDAYDEGEIDFAEYNKRKDAIMNKRGITVGELNMVAKEAFNQSQIESGKPTSITNSPEQAKKNLETLLKAIKSGNEEDIAKAIFIEG
jgi:hypothetical protein